MADELNYGALDEELYCSSSSFEENSDESAIYSETDDLGNGLAPLGIRPYQFESVKRSETSSLKTKQDVKLFLMIENIKTNLDDLDEHQMLVLEDDHIKATAKDDSFGLDQPENQVSEDDRQKMDDLSRIPVSHCPKVFVQRDYTNGTTLSFQNKFPTELDGKVDVATFQETVSTLNRMYLEAETLSGKTYCESCMACLTAYLSYICFDTHYEKMLKKIRHYIEEQNRVVYVPRGLMLIDPVERGLRVLEVCLLSESSGGR